MTKSDEQIAEEILLRWFSKKATPVEASEMINRLLRAHATPQGRRLTPMVFRRAVWNLVDSGKISFTRDRKLQKAG